MRARGLVAAALAILMIAGGAGPAQAADGPVVSATGLTDGQLVGMFTPIEPVVGDDAVTLQILVNGELIQSVRWPAKLLSVVPPTELHDTDAVVTLRAFDAAGATGEASTTVRVDAQQPELAWAPRGNSLVRGPTTITLTPSVDDLAVLIMYGPDRKELARRTEAPWTFERDFTEETTGRVHFQAYDRAGNRSPFYEVTYYVDKDGPKINVDVPEHVLPGPRWLVARVSDVSGVERIEWWVDGALRSTETRFEYDFGTRIRKVPLEVRAWDRLGHSAVVSRPVQLDATGPVISRVTPAQNALVRGTRTAMSLTATDPAGIAAVTVDQLDVPRDMNGNYTLSRSTGRDGRHVYSWFAYDTVGNASVNYRFVTVDNTLPKITSVTAPNNGSKVPATVKTRMAATDLNGIHHVELRINGKKILSDSKAPYYLNLNATRYGRSFTVTFAAVDKAGNAISTSRRTWKR